MRPLGRFTVRRGPRPIPSVRFVVVEDEVKVAQRLRNGHSENGQWADLTHDVIEGRRLASGGEYDLVLLDVTLPGVDGSGVLPARSQLWCKTPRLMLTARDEVEDHFSGLEGGADDHLVMPSPSLKCWRGWARCCGAARPRPPRSGPSGRICMGHALDVRVP